MSLPISNMVSTAAIASLLFDSAAHAVFYDEGVSGDLSGSFSAPTNLGAFGLGIHTIIATDSGGARDIFTFSVPAGMSLTSIVNASYVGADGTAFIGIGSGTTLDGSGTAESLLGYTHFGTGPGTVGAEIIDDIAAGAGAQGFTPPLGPGDYTVWMQQVGASATWRLDFNVVPEPTSLGLLALGAMPLLFRRRPRR